LRVVSPGQIWNLTPQSIKLECARRGRDAVVDGCIALLQREVRPG
jgi:hypothetical protein